jgi:hypothetical protein
MAKNTRVGQRVKFLGTSAPCLGCWSVLVATNALTDSLKGKAGEMGFSEMFQFMTCPA